uniref:Uncharacterized protein At2g33490-like n=1 Tax=Rhizophora mucronata TaxID=61149 RepID=A0A2P2M075_RHIMU
MTCSLILVTSHYLAAPATFCVLPMPLLLVLLALSLQSLTYLLDLLRYAVIYMQLYCYACCFNNDLSMHIKCLKNYVLFYILWAK